MFVRFKKTNCSACYQPSFSPVEVKLKLVGKVAESFNSQSRHPKLTRSGFFPSPATLDILYGYATDGYRSPLWLCASHNGRAMLIHRNRGTKVDFAQAVSEKRIRAVDGIHFFDAHRQEPQLLSAPALQLDSQAENTLLAHAEKDGEP